MTNPNDISDFLNAWQQTFNDRDWDSHCDMYAEDVLFSIPPGPTVLNGRAAVRSALEGFTTTYADIQLTVRRSVDDSDLTAVEWDEIGTETASGAEAVFKFSGMIDFTNGQISSVAHYGGRQP